MVDRLFGPVEMEKCMSQYSVQNGGYDMMQCKKGKKKENSDKHAFYCPEASLVGPVVLSLRRLIINKGAEL